MAQTLSSALVASGKSGTVLISDINNITGSILSSHSGASRPSYAVTGTFWLNTGDGEIYYYNGSTDVSAASALSALALDGGTVSGTITISGDGEELHTPGVTINPDAAAASDIGAIDWRNKADVLRAKTYYNESDDTWNIALYDTSGVLQGGATFGWNASYGVALTTPVVNASGIFYGPDTNNGARIANIQGGYTIFGDIRSISMDWTTTPKRLYVSDSAASQTYYWASDGASDMRLKTNVEPIAIDAQADILALEFFQHDWLPEAQTIGHVDLAMSAQQSEKIAFGSTHAVPRPENSPLDFDPLHIELRPWVLRLLVGYQQQQEEINALRAEIAAMKGT